MSAICSHGLELGYSLITGLLYFFYKYGVSLTERVALLVATYELS